MFTRDTLPWANACGDQSNLAWDSSCKHGVVRPKGNARSGGQVSDKGLSGFLARCGLGRESSELPVLMGFCLTGALDQICHNPLCSVTLAIGVQPTARRSTMPRGQQKSNKKSKKPKKEKSTAASMSFSWALSESGGATKKKDK